MHRLPSVGGHEHHAPDLVGLCEAHGRSRPGAVADDDAVLKGLRGTREAVDDKGEPLVLPGLDGI